MQKTDTAELKREAVRLAQTSGKPIAKVARELNISDTSIHQWRKELGAHGLVETALWIALVPCRIEQIAAISPNSLLAFHRRF